MLSSIKNYIFLGLVMIYICKYKPNTYNYMENNKCINKLQNFISGCEAVIRTCEFENIPFKSANKYWNEISKESIEYQKACKNEFLRYFSELIVKDKYKVYNTIRYTVSRSINNIQNLINENKLIKNNTEQNVNFIFDIRQLNCDLIESFDNKLKEYSKPPEGITKTMLYNKKFKKIYFCREGYISSIKELNPIYYKQLRHYKLYATFYNRYDINIKVVAIDPSDLNSYNGSITLRDSYDLFDLLNNISINLILHKEIYNKGYKIPKSIN